MVVGNLLVCTGKGSVSGVTGIDKLGVHQNAEKKPIRVRKSVVIDLLQPSKHVVLLGWSEGTPEAVPRFIEEGDNCTHFYKKLVVIGES